MPEKKENSSKAFIELSLPDREGIIFDLSTQGGGQEETVDVVIDNDYDNCFRNRLFLLKKHHLNFL